MALLFFFLIIIPSAIIHEYMHGWTADRLGDPTARYAGRLTLNPVPHIDLFGTILMPVLLFFSTGGAFLFAYAKPVPYDPRYLKWPRWGPALVGAAGPLANILVAVILGVVAALLPIDPGTKIAGLRGFLSDPLVGGWQGFYSLLLIIMYANIGLAIFNLVPIPPLDGSKLLLAILPDSMVEIRTILEQYGFFLLILFIFFGFGLIMPIIRWVFSLLVSLSFL